MTWTTNYELAIEDPEKLGIALEALREMHGMSRDDLAEATGLPMQWIELCEDYGWLTLDRLSEFADAYGLEPGVLLDAATSIAVAERIDVMAERRDNEQADKLLELLEAHPMGVSHEQMEAAGVATNNMPLNLLYDRGVPVEEVREPYVEPARKRNFGRPVGVRLRQPSGATQ